MAMLLRPVIDASRRLKYLSFAHSAVYAVLLSRWRSSTRHAGESVFGWAHGLGWIVMSLLVPRRRARAA